MAAATPVSAPATGSDWALRREFARLLVLAVVLPALTLSAVFAWRDAMTRRDRVGERLVAVAASAAQEIDDFLQTHRAVVQVLAERRSSEGSLTDHARWTSDFARLRRHYPGLRTMLVADASGRVLGSAPPRSSSVPRAGSVADRPYFTEPRRSGRSYVSDVFRGRVLSSDILVAVSAPLTADGRFAGVVEGSIPVGAFAALRGGWLQERGIEVLLLDRGFTVVHATGGLRYAPLDVLGDDPVARQVRTFVAGADTRARSLGGVLRDGNGAHAVSVPLDVGWSLLVLVPEHVLESELRRNAKVVLGLLALVTAGVLLVAWRQMARLSRSVEYLLDRMHRVVLDHAAVPIAPGLLPSELAPLAEAMSQLQTRLGDAYRDTSRSLEEQRRLRESLEQVVDAREQEIAQRTEELRRAVAELDRLSRTDALTGCLNYRGYRELAEGLWRQAHATGQPLSALALDIDHFKAYNDRYGHQSGDNALQRFTGAVRSALYHREDVVVRHGGEEFIVFLPGTTLEQAQQVAERVRASVIHADIAHAGSPVGVLTVSIGIACLQPEDGDDLKTLLARADEALYRAKRDGRNRHSL